MSPAAKAREAVNGRTTTSARTSSRARLIDRRGGPRYGPPDRSSEGGYAPLGLPRPSLGRAPAQPWRASGLTQDVSSSLHHERAVPIDLEGEARRHHDRRGRQRDDRGPREPRAGAERLAVEDVGVGEGGLLGHPGATAAT